MINNNKVKILMSGQEWYDRFEKEMSGNLFEHSNVSHGYVLKVLEECKEAAKRAAGLEQS